jgi:DnaJ-class molecular chaperone
VESYLDRTHPGWRDDIHADHAKRQSASARAGGMDANEAYEILGLEPGASEADVREAHRRLMKQVHPDRGGSAALAAKINEAKDRILGRHR